VTIRIEHLHDLPSDRLAELLAASEQEGFRFLCRLVQEWADDTNGFSRPGEALFIASVSGRVVGICGINADPYTAERRVGRVRHFYVLPAFRRRGIGRRLIQEVITAARGMFDRLRLRTENPAAVRFYEALGFRLSPDLIECTHIRVL
jgi:ribosomal protein S18 acetylase RimI-like enzyme